MASHALKIPRLGWEIPRPRPWDLAAILALVVSMALAGANLASVMGLEPGRSASGTLTAGFVLAQLALTSISLLVLGKTAKEGTIWGNLAAVAGMMAGIGGGLLAVALWTVA